LLGLSEESFLIGAASYSGYTNSYSFSSYIYSFGFGAFGRLVLRLFYCSLKCEVNVSFFTSSDSVRWLFFELDPLHSNAFYFVDSLLFAY